MPEPTPAGRLVAVGICTAALLVAVALLGQIPFGKPSSMAGLRLSLRNPDFTTARRMADAINAYIGRGAARAENPSTVRLNRMASYDGDMIDLLAEVEQLRVQPDLPARIVIDENTGTIVMGENVRVSTVAIAQGNLTITVSETPVVFVGPVTIRSARWVRPVIP